MLTLVEWSKTNPDPLQSGVVEIFAKESPILSLMPFQNVAGSAYKWNIEGALPGIAFRDYNGSYTESTGVVQSAIEALRLMGGDSDYDIAHIAMQTGDNATRAVYDAMKAKAVANQWNKSFFNGDSTANPLEFDGLAGRLTGAQVKDGAGDALSLDMLDELIDAVQGEPSALFLSKATRRKVTKLARGTANLEWKLDQWGRQVAHYAGVPLAAIEADAAGNAVVLDSEIYAVRFGADGVHGIQTSPVSVRDLGELETKPALRTRIEHYGSFVIKAPRAAARLDNFA